MTRISGISSKFKVGEVVKAQLMSSNTKWIRSVISKVDKNTYYLKYGELEIALPEHKIKKTSQTQQQLTNLLRRQNM